MKVDFRRFTQYVFGLLAFALTLAPVKGMSVESPGRSSALIAKLIQDTPASSEESVPLDRSNPHIQAAIAVQERHNGRLRGIPEVVGTAVGLNDADKPAILVLTRKEVGAGVIPEVLEGVPVVVKVTGEIIAMESFSAAKVSPTARFARPVPIGVSTGNAGECSAGTIGARVKSGTNVYALSNNHVYALENRAAIGSDILQPGLYDTGCVYNSDNVIGQLAAFVPINFSGGNNKVDAAIALSSTANLGKATPSNGYGTPQSTIATAAINDHVQKYGRTTSLTKGTITGINATVTVDYGAAGTATFVNQIVVYSGKPIIKAGDSGSLVVTDPGLNPVGLMFAGTSSGKYAIANPIADVLADLGVTIDGQ